MNTALDMNDAFQPATTELSDQDLDSVTGGIAPLVVLGICVLGIAVIKAAATVLKTINDNEAADSAR